MSPNKNKQKGSAWERELVDELNKELEGTFKRVPASGAMGTSLGEGLLMGDIVGQVEGLVKKLRIECKTGYGGSTQLTIKKEWLDKIKSEAESTFSIPALACKFSGARAGVKRFVVLDIDTFIFLLNEIQRLGEERSGH